VKDTLGLLYLLFVRRLSSFGGSKCIGTIRRISWGPQAVSFVESVISVTQFSYLVYRAFLYYLYSDEIDLPPEESLGLLDLAISYFEDRLKYKCEQLIKQSVMVDNVAMVYEAAMRYKSDDLLGFCFRFAMEHMTHVVQSEAFANLEESTLKEFIQKAAERGAFKT
jgi:RCC1 and BTB domain-containing protein